MPGVEEGRHGDRQTDLPVRGGRLILRVRRALRNQGPLGVLDKVIRKIINIFYQRRQLLVYESDLRKSDWFATGAPRRPEPAVAVTIRRATEDDLSRLRKITTPKEYKRILLWFSAGNHCFLALDGDNIVYYIWITFKDHRIEAVKRPLKLAEGDVFPYMSETLPEYKNMNIFPAVAAEMLAFCVSKGRYRIVSAIRPEDYRSFKALYKRKGFGVIRPVRMITYRRIVGIGFHHIEEVNDESRLIAMRRRDNDVRDRGSHRAKSLGIS